MTPETITAIIASVAGLGTCFSVVFGALGALIAVIVKNRIDARNAESTSRRADIELEAKVKHSEVGLLRQQIIDSSDRHKREIDRLIERYNQEIDSIRARCQEDRLADRSEMDGWKIEATRLEKENTELGNKLNGERRENYRIRALAYKAGFEIPDEQRKSDFTKPIDAAQQAELLGDPK